MTNQPTFLMASLGETQEVSAPLEGSKRGFHLEWMRSVWFSLLISGIVGLLYALIVMGPAPLNPRNTGWLTSDAATYYIGWELFRQDPNVHWPLTYTDRVGYPYGESVALFDLNPLLALVLKPLSPVLPNPCQYLGLEVVLLCALQFFFALRLFQLILGPGFLGIALSSVFFLLSPPLNYRLVGHYALSNHWLLVAALLIFFMTQERAATATRNFVIASAVLAGVSVAINPYIAFQVAVLLTAAAVSLLWKRRLTLTQAAGVMVLLGATCVAVAYSLGLVIAGGRGYAASGYRYYSMNLLAPLDPYGLGSILYRRLPHLTEGQYEGYNYLGAGMIVLTVIVSGMAVLSRGKLRSLDKRWAVPLLVSCFLLTLMAASTKVSIGSATLIDLDPSERLSAYFALLRATGRLFWAPYYTILTVVVAAVFLFFRKTTANLLIACALLLQLSDTHPLRRWVNQTVNDQHPTPLKSPIWSKLGSLHQNLVVLPAWQCGPAFSPGGLGGYRIFGMLAAEQRMRINSYYSARYTEAARDRECTQSMAALTERPLSADSAYVVTPSVATLIVQGPTGPGKCHYLDRFILCSSKTDFGLRPSVFTPEAVLQNSLGNPSFEEGDLSPWAVFKGVRVTVTTAQAHAGSRSLAESGEGGSVYQDVTGLQPGATYTISAWVFGSPGVTATAQIATFAFGADAPTFSPPLTPRSGWQLLSQSVTVRQEGTVRVHLMRNLGSGTIYWDDIRIDREK